MTTASVYPDILTPEQVASYLQLNKDTVYHLIRDHLLAAVKIGRSYRIMRSDLDTFLAANSSREQVRQNRFQRYLAIGEATGLDGDDLLDELEAGAADYLVTGDKLLLARVDHAGASIVSPREFVALLHPE